MEDVRRLPAGEDDEMRVTLDDLAPDPMAQQQLGEPMPAAHQIHPDRVTRTRQVAERLLLSW